MHSPVDLQHRLEHLHVCRLKLALLLLRQHLGLHNIKQCRGSTTI
jgi:hypothetical protein